MRINVINIHKYPKYHQMARNLNVFDFCALFWWDWRYTWPTVIRTSDTILTSMGKNCASLIINFRFFPKKGKFCILISDCGVRKTCGNQIIKKKLFWETDMNRGDEGVAANIVQRQMCEITLETRQRFRTYSEWARRMLYTQKVWMKNNAFIHFTGKEKSETIILLISLSGVRAAKLICINSTL